MLNGSMIPRSVRRIFDGRSEPREATGSQPAVLELRGSSHEVRLINLSASGAMIDFDAPPILARRSRWKSGAAAGWRARSAGFGTAISALLLPRRRSSGQVEMSFSMIRARIGETADPDERRSTSRFSVEFDARVRELGANGVDARILNISESGFMAEADGQFEVGARIWLMLPGRGRANAVVKWIAGGKLGAQFSAPVSLEDFRTGATS